MSVPKLTVYQTADDLHLAELQIPSGIEFPVSDNTASEIHDVVIVDGSGSMGSWVSFLVKNVIPSLYYDALAVDPTKKIPLFVFEARCHEFNFDQDGFKSSTVSSMGGTYMQSTIEKVTQHLTSLPEGSTVRILTVSDGDIFDQQPTLDLASEAIAKINNHRLTVLSQAVRLFTSSYASPDTRALASVMQWDNVGSPQLIEVNPFGSKPVVTDDMLQFKSASFLGRVPMSTDVAGIVHMQIISQVVAAFEAADPTVPFLTVEAATEGSAAPPLVMRVPWAPAAPAMRMRHPELAGGSAALWCTGNFDPAVCAVTARIGSVAVEVEHHAQLTVDVYQRLMVQQTAAALTQGALLQVVGNNVSRAQLKKLASLFSRVECALNIITEEDTVEVPEGSVSSDQKARVRRLRAMADKLRKQSRGVSMRLSEMANDDKVSKLNSAQAAEYLRSVGTGAAGKALARRAAQGAGDDDSVVRAEVRALAANIDTLEGVDDEDCGISFVSQCGTADGLRALAAWLGEAGSSEILDSLPLAEVLELVPVVGVALAGPRGDYPDPFTYKATQVHACHVCAADLLQARRFCAVLRAPGQGSHGRTVTAGSAGELSRPAGHSEDEYRAGDVTACAPTLHPAVRAFLDKHAPRTQSLLASVSMRAAMVDIPQTADAITAAAITSLCIRVSSGKARTEATAAQLARLIAMRSADRLGADMALFRQLPAVEPFPPTEPAAADHALYDASVDAAGIATAPWIGDLPLGKLLASLAVKGLKDAKAGGVTAASPIPAHVAAIMRAGAVRAAYLSADQFLPHLEVALSLEASPDANVTLARTVGSVTRGYLQSVLCEADLKSLCSRLQPLFRDEAWPVKEGVQRRLAKAKKQRLADGSAAPDAAPAVIVQEPSYNGWLAALSPIWRRALDALLWLTTAYRVGRAAGSVEVNTSAEAVSAVLKALSALPEQGTAGVSVSLPLAEVPGLALEDDTVAPEDAFERFDSDEDEGWGAAQPQTRRHGAPVQLPVHGMVQGVPPMALRAAMPFFKAQGSMAAPFIPRAVQTALAEAGVADVAVWALWVTQCAVSGRTVSTGCYPDYVKAYISHTMTADPDDAKTPGLPWMATVGLTAHLPDPHSAFQLRVAVSRAAQSVAASCMQRALGGKAAREEALLGRVMADVVVRGSVEEAAAVMREGLPRHTQAFVLVQDGKGVEAEDLLQAWRDSRGVSVAEANGPRCPDGNGSECVFKWRNGGTTGARTAWMRLLSPNGDGQGRLDVRRLVAKTQRQDMAVYSREHATPSSVAHVVDRWAKVTMMLTAVDAAGNAVWNEGVPLRDLDMERGRHYWCGEAAEDRERWMQLYKTWKAATGGNKTDGQPRKRKSAKK